MSDASTLSTETGVVIVSSSSSTTELTSSSLSEVLAMTSSDQSINIETTESDGVLTYDLSVNSSSSEESDSSSSSYQVAVDEDSEPGYLEDVLVSDTDAVTLTKSSSQLRVSFDTEITSDPKYETCSEVDIDTETSNYGSYSLGWDSSGSQYEKLVWGDSSSASYINAIVYQHMRLADSQGTVTKVNIAVIGSPAWEDPVPCINIGLFDLDGNLLGQTGLKFLGEDFENNTLVTFDITEESSGSLHLERNQRYIVQVWSCGLQIAAKDKTTSSYTYDYTLRQNLQSSASSLEFLEVDSSLFVQASVVPYVSLGATALND